MNRKNKLCFIFYFFIILKKKTPFNKVFFFLKGPFNKVNKETLGYIIGLEYYIFIYAHIKDAIPLSPVFFFPKKTQSFLFFFNIILFSGRNHRFLTPSLLKKMKRKEIIAFIFGYSIQKLTFRQIK